MLELDNMGMFFANCRKESDLSQEEVAEITGISEKTIHNIEHGRCEPELDTVLKLCDIYDIELNRIQRFYYRSEEMNYMIKEFYEKKIKSSEEKVRT